MVKRGRGARGSARGGRKAPDPEPEQATEATPKARGRGRGRGRPPGRSRGRGRGRGGKAVGVDDSPLSDMNLESEEEPSSSPEGLESSTTSVTINQEYIDTSSKNENDESENSSSGSPNPADAENVLPGNLRKETEQERPSSDVHAQNEDLATHDFGQDEERGSRGKTKLEKNSDSGVASERSPVEGIHSDDCAENAHIDRELAFSRPPAKRKVEQAVFTSGNGQMNDVARLDPMEIPSSPKRPLLDENIRKLLPDVDRYWKPVDFDPTDFVAWTLLVRYVDQENNLPVARNAFDAFLENYPLCYGYWKKYADFEKRNASPEECEKIFQRGLRAIPLSVDLWIHYLNHIKATHEADPDFIRSQFEEAIDSSGLEFRSDKLWENYIQWELDGNRLQNVLGVYDKVIRVPTHSHQTHFQNLKEFIKKNQPVQLLARDVYDELKARVTKLNPSADEKSIASLMKDLMIQEKSEIYKLNEKEVQKRVPFEEAIKRPYFHVKPLEKGQLETWRDYLDFEIENGDERRVVILFERCLIACALYEDFWIRYVTHLQGSPTSNAAKIREVFSRACLIHHKKKPWINLYWCFFEESEGNFTRVVQLYDAIEKKIPDSVQIQYRRIQFERRRENLEECERLFQKYIGSAKDKPTSVDLTIKYAYFVQYVLKNYEKAKQILEAVSSEDESLQSKVVLALIDIGFRYQDNKLINSQLQKVLQSTVASKEVKIKFAHRNIEFQEEYGTAHSIELAHQQLLKLSRLAGANETNASSETADSATYSSEQAPTSIGYDYNQYGQYASWNPNATNYVPTAPNYSQQTWTG